jgi:hypothetical protein
MFNLLTPIWLTAIAALSIPVIIHLWNIRPGKVLKVGSISLMAEASRKSSRSFNLMDIILLLLRCLFLLLLALVLAGPYKNTQLKPVQIKGWILIPRQYIHQVYTNFKPKVDSLIKAGYQLHYFSDGFTAIDTAQFKTLKDSAGTSLNTWALLKQLGTTIPANLPVYLFTCNSLSSLNGNKPELVNNLHIQTFTPADSTKKWISGAVINNADAIKITEGNSSPKGTTLISTSIQQTDQRNSRYQINTNNGQLLVAFKNDSINHTVDTTTLSIAIYSDKSTDAEYLKAALNAVKQFTARKIVIQTAKENNIIRGRVDWVFWLKDRRVALMAAEHVKNVFVYEPGKAQSLNSWISLNSNDHIDLTKLISTGGILNQTIWPDGFGNPVLTLQYNGKANIYHFYSRFDASWGDLVWDNAFPRMMLDLLFKDNSDDINDRRIVDTQQLTPKLSTEKLITTEVNLTAKTDLTKIFWLALVVVLFIERWFAHRNKTENYG